MSNKDGSVKTDIGFTYSIKPKPTAMYRGNNKITHISHFILNQVMYEDDKHTSENGNEVLKMAMCVFQLGTDPLSLLSMLSADLQVNARNITAQITIYNLCSILLDRSQSHKIIQKGMSNMYVNIQMYTSSSFLLLQIASVLFL